MRKNMTLLLVASVGVAACIGLVFFLITSNLRSLNGVIIRNTAATPADGVLLVLSDMNGRQFLRREVRRLASGEEVRYRHGHNDFTATLTFVLDGREHEYQESYIDVWSGEPWCFAIDLNGAVSGNYESLLSGPKHGAQMIPRTLPEVTGFGSSKAVERFRPQSVNGYKKCMCF